MDNLIPVAPKRPKKITTHGETIAISGLEPRVQRSPLLGEHTEYILKDLLGMEELEVDQLYVDARDEAPLAPSPKAESIAAARDTVSDIISAQDSVIDGLSARLAG